MGIAVLIAVIVLLAAATPLLVLHFRRDEQIQARNRIARAEQKESEAQDRCDRLMEALARKGGSELFLPTTVSRLEEPTGWFDKKSPQVVVKINGEDVAASPVQK